MAKSGTTIRVGTTVPGSQAHTPTVDRAVGGDSSNTQAQPGPDVCGNTGRLCAEAEAGDGNREQRKAASSSATADGSVSVCGQVCGCYALDRKCLPKSHAEAMVASRWHFWEVVEPCP